MGRNCGWLTAATARAYRERLETLDVPAGLQPRAGAKDIDAIYVPEMAIDIEAEARAAEAASWTARTASASSSARAPASHADRRRDAGRAARRSKRDAFGHVKLDKVNVGDWFSKQFAKLVGAEQTLVQKSGYFARSAPANAEDLRLIQSMVDMRRRLRAARRVSGVIGHDEERGGVLRAIEFPRIKGGKPFDIGDAWFGELLQAIGQPVGERAAGGH